MPTIGASLGSVAGASGVRERYVHLRSAVLTEAKTHAWRRQGNALTLVGPTGHEAAVRFVASKWCTADLVEFALEGVVRSPTLSRFDPASGTGKVTSSDGHWSTRLTPPANDWWRVDEDEQPTPDAIVQALQSDLQPAVVRHMDDAALLAEFTPVLDTPATDPQRAAAYAAALSVALQDEPLASKARGWLASGESLNPASRWFTDQLRRLDAEDWRG